MARLSSGWIAGVLLLLAAVPAFAARDVMIVLDNSGSMKVNDPGRLATSAVTEFIAGQPRDTRVGIVLFTGTPELVLPLMPAEVAADGEAATALRKFNYRGAWTQTASAVERGLYELRNEGRSDATRAIVLMTDGLIDTGDKHKDDELNQWLRGELASQAKRENVRIFGVAFTERADYQLLQSLASTTGGEYFRVLNPEGISRALKRIDSIMVTPMAPPVAATQTPAPVEAVPVETPPPAEVEEAPAQPQGGASRLWWIVALLVVLAIAGALVWRLRFAKGATREAANEQSRHDHGPTAVLYNNQERHELGGQPIVLGRAGGNDPTRQYIIVPEKTVGRWHATIERRGQTFWVRDEGSVNGTFVNDERVIGEQPLKHGDSLRLHTHRYEFEIPELADADRTMLSPKSRLSA